MTDLDELADALSDFAEPEKKTGKSTRDERIISGFEEIQRFYDQHGRAPQHGENRDIFERLYVVRLDRLRAQEDCRVLLSPLDTHGLLDGAAVSTAADQDLSEDELLEALEGMSSGEDICDLQHVRGDMPLQKRRPEGATVQES